MPVPTDGRNTNDDVLVGAERARSFAPGPTGAQGAAITRPTRDDCYTTAARVRTPACAHPLSPGGLRHELARWRWALFPAYCRFCAEPAGVDLDLCAVCAADLPFVGASCRRCGLPQPLDVDACARCETDARALDRTVAVFHYAPPVDRLIADIKFHARLPTGALLGALLAARIAGHRDARELPDRVVPVPLAWRRLFVRGHDQAALLARATAAALRKHGLHVRVDDAALVRTRHTAPQARLRGRARRDAFASAATPLFAARRRLDGEHIALVDDVFTTGATLGAAARALRAAGARRVDAWVIARTLPGSASARDDQRERSSPRSR